MACLNLGVLHVMCVGRSGTPSSQLPKGPPGWGRAHKHKHCAMLTMVCVLRVPRAVTYKALVHIITVRCRVLGNLTANHMPEDGIIKDILDFKAYVPLGYIFRASLFAFSDATEQQKKGLAASVSRLVGTANNNSLNEPFFFVAAGALVALESKMGGDGLGGLGASLVYTWLSCRIVHNIAFVAGVQPVRALGWFTSALLLVAFAGAALNGALSA